MNAIVLIDGEHYPPVVKSALDELGKTHNVLAAVFLGGTEKIKGLGEVGQAYGVKVFSSGDYLSDIVSAVSEHKPDVVFDLSDEPVITYDDRFIIASELAFLGVDYVGADFSFKAVKYQEIFKKPSISVIGTGKRIGKTAVSGFICRVLKDAGYDPVAVTMGRGGPEYPEVIHGEKIEVTPQYLLNEANQGKHASSDHYEDALTSRVTTVGCRRCGGGMMGQPYFTVVVDGCRIAEKLKNDFVVLDGSGATYAPVKTDYVVTVAGANQKTDYITGFFGRYRIKRADIVVLTHCEEPMASHDKIEKIVSGIKSINPAAKIVRTVFRPKPLGDIRGKKVFYCTTAADCILDKIKEYLEGEYGCEVVGMTNKLSNRPLLAKDLRRSGDSGVFLTELKAAAVDIVTKHALEKGKEVIYCDNIPETCGEGLKSAVMGLLSKD